MGEGSVTHSRHMQVLHERDSYIKELILLRGQFLHAQSLCRSLYEEVHNGTEPQERKSATMEQHQEEWPFLWEKIKQICDYVKQQGF
jgi:hypothetical protein